MDGHNVLTVTAKIHRFGLHAGETYYHAEMALVVVIGTGETPEAAVRDFINRTATERRRVLPDIVVHGTQTLTVKEFLR